MFDGTPFNGDFCYQIMLNLEGTPDNVFRTPFNVSNTSLNDDNNTTGRIQFDVLTEGARQKLMTSYQ